MGRKQIDRLLLWAVDAGLVTSIALVPVVMGGRIALGQLVLVVAAFCAAGCWCLRQCIIERGTWYRTPADLLLLTVLAFVGFQLIPLPPAWLETLSPNLYKSLPLWSPHNEAAGTLGVWNTLSLTPAAGREGFVLIMAFVLLFLTAVQRLRRLEDIEQLLRVIAITTTAMAAFALLQYVAGNGKYFWFFRHPFFHTHGNVLGSFTNRNHFAQFIALGIGPVIWWAIGGLHSDHRKRRLGATLRFVALALVVFAGLMSLSRGGSICILLAGTLCIFIAWRGALIGGKTVFALAGSALLTGALLCTYGFEMVASRLDDLVSINELDKNHGRLTLWLDDGLAVSDYPLTGTGLGSHLEVCPMYHFDGRLSQDLEYTHAENGYVQVALEGGIPGLLLALSAMGLCVYWCARPFFHNPSPHVRLCIAAVASGLAANFLHSLADFVWYIPGCMVVAVMLAAAACRLCRLATDIRPEASRAAVSRPGWGLAAVCLLVIGCIAIHGRIQAVSGEYHWYRYLVMDKGFHRLDEAARHEVIKSKVSELDAVLKYQPHHARAHCRLAGLHLHLFNSLPEGEASTLNVRQVREAAMASSFDSPQALEDWLLRAFGDRVEHLHQAWKHSRQALAECPLQGEAYLYLAELCFLEKPGSPSKDAYIAQALTVRPHDAAVAFEAGNEALLDGDLERACLHWQASFRASRFYQSLLMKNLARRVDATFVIETFHPDATALDLLGEYYRRAGRVEDYLFVLNESATAHAKHAAAASGKEACRNWIKAAEAYQKLDSQPKRLACLQEAVRSDLSSYDARYILGKCCYDQGNFEDAVEHLKWCLRERPFDPTLRLLVESALNERLRLGRRRIDE